MTYGFLREFDWWWLHKIGASVLQKNAIVFAIGGTLSEKPEKKGYGSLLVKS